MGVVNNRIDIDALAKSSGGGAGGGAVADILWQGNITDTYKDITEDLAAPIEDYALLTAVQALSNTVSAGGVLPVELMSSASNNINTILIGSIQVRLRLGEGTVSIASTTTQNGISLIGIK